MLDTTTAWLNSLTKETLVSMVQNQAEQIKQLQQNSIPNGWVLVPKEPTEAPK